MRCKLGESNESSNPSDIKIGGTVSTLDLPLKQPNESVIHPRVRVLPEEPAAKGKREPCAMMRFDYALIGVTVLLLFPAFHFAHLPMRFDFARMAGAFWGGLAVEATFAAVVLAVLGLPLEQSLGLGVRLRGERKTRIALALVLAIYILFIFKSWLGVVFAIDVLCLSDLIRQSKQAFRLALADVFFPSLYLFCGLVLTFALNHAIAGIRYAGTYDPVFEQIDLAIFHVRVSDIANWGLSHLPHWFFELLEKVYLSITIQVGAVLILAALLGNRRYAMSFVRALLVCYSLALIAFFAWPAKGPYSTSPVLVSSCTQSLTVFRTQGSLLARIRMLWAHDLTSNLTSVNALDYFISFPCMHVALPTIAIWFLRPWKKIAFIFLALDGTLLIPSIVLLNWHYLVDLLGGFAVALLSIYLVHCLSKAGIHNELQIDAK